MTQDLQHGAGSGHETRDVSARPIVLAGVLLAFLLAVAGGVGYGIFSILAAYRPTVDLVSPLATSAQIPPAPRIEEHGSEELQQLRGQEERLLSTYGWVDKAKGVVRIPIDRAMELQLERGLPTRKEQPQR
jgi:hypothetical protein